MCLQAVQREPSEGSTGWEHLLSEDLADWYSPEDGPSFRKRRLSFAGFAVVVEASEFADVLMTGLDPTEVAQGMETPMEDSTDLVTDCGQSFVFPFYMRYEIEKVGQRFTSSVCSMKECECTKRSPLNPSHPDQLYLLFFSRYQRRSSQRFPRGRVEAWRVTCRG